MASNLIKGNIRQKQIEGRLQNISPILFQSFQVMKDKERLRNWRREEAKEGRILGLTAGEMGIRKLVKPEYTLYFS